MPSPESANLVQRAVLWSFSNVDDYGNVVVNSPVEIRVRWEGAAGQQLSPLTASEMDVATVVYVDQYIPLRSLLWFGRLRDVPSLVTELGEVKNYNDTPDIKGRSVLKTVSIIRYGNSLPTVLTN